jgi:hypothetical protein
MAEALLPGSTPATRVACLRKPAFQFDRTQRHLLQPEIARGLRELGPGRARPWVRLRRQGKPLPHAPARAGEPGRGAGQLFSSGVLALGRKCGPFLWQLPPGLAFDPARLEAFLASLPRDSQSAARLARRHHRRLRYGALAKTTVRVRYRHALEVRHASFACEECYDLLRAYRTALVTADTAGRYPCLDQPTADFAYLRLHGSRVLYASGYSDRELAAWADRIAGGAWSMCISTMAGRCTPRGMPRDSRPSSGSEGWSFPCRRPGTRAVRRHPGLASPRAFARARRAPPIRARSRARRAWWARA